MSEQRRTDDAGRSPFGLTLIRFRTMRGFSQEGLSGATNLQISTRSITNYESPSSSESKWVLPHRPSINILADALKLSADERQHLVDTWQQTQSLRNSRQRVDESGIVLDGRESQFDQIMAAWRRATAGTPQVVFLGGISGIGKTSLMRIFTTTVQSRDPGVMVTSGAASSWATQFEPYLAFRMTIDRMLIKSDRRYDNVIGLSSRPKLTSEAIERILASVPQLSGSLISVRALHDMATESKSIDIDAIDSLVNNRIITDAIERYDVFANLIIELSRSWPLIVLVQNLHWAGESTAALLSHLIDRLRDLEDTPILLACSYRSDEMRESAPGVPHPITRSMDTAGHSSQITRLQMNTAMTPANGKSFIAAILQGTPMADVDEELEIVSWLYHKTSGHPYLTCELIRNLKMTGALAQCTDSELWRFDKTRVSSDQIVAIATFISQRLDELSSIGRKILEVASIMETIVWPEIIADILQMDLDSVMETIDKELVDRHNLLEMGADPNTIFSSSHIYSFPRALQREYVYNSLSPARRNRLHSSTATAIDARFPEPDATMLGEIAGHYVRAENWPAAQQATLNLGLLAAGRMDWDIALTFYDQSEELALLAKVPEQLWRVRAARMAVMRGLGDYDGAIALGERLLELSEAHNWRRTRAMTLHHFGEVYYDIGEINL